MLQEWVVSLPSTYHDLRTLREHAPLLRPSRVLAFAKEDEHG